ncbi:DUF3368 domain-containing protein [Leptolyngbya sp. AN03gr2]|uniref:DUF3368 domain-containing protein n=1 Tax=unclassified Leptolyngbya TaxID=2650499 RepID=UPI003D30FA85
MLVVSDTSPICYLALIEQIDLLPRLYGQIFIPDVVRDELANQDAPDIVQAWISSPPEWLTISTTTKSSDSELMELDRGEQAAILLAEELEATLVLIDERKGRSISRSRGLRITGLLGVLDDAATLKLIDLPTTIAKLQTTNFHVSSRLIKALLNKNSQD